MRLGLAILAALAGIGPASAERLVLSLSSNLVTIGSNYTGTRLVAYGIVERDAQSATRSGAYDVVVTVRGPREALTVRRKDQVGPIWLNRSQLKFVQIPSYLAVNTTRPVAEFMDAGRRQRFRIGIPAIVDAPEFSVDRGQGGDAFRAALIRLKERDGLYKEEPRAVTFVTDGFFRSAIPLPATAPVGNYEVEVKLVADGLVVAHRDASFELVKTGFEEQITEAARDRPLTLGLATAGLSLLFGWFASIIFRRD